MLGEDLNLPLAPSLPSSASLGARTPVGPAGHLAVHGHPVTSLSLDQRAQARQTSQVGHLREVSLPLTLHGEAALSPICPAAHFTILPLWTLLAVVFRGEATLDLFQAAMALTATIFCRLQHLSLALLKTFATVNAAQTPVSPSCESARFRHDSIALNSLKQICATWSSIYRILNYLALAVLLTACHGKVLALAPCRPCGYETVLCLGALAFASFGLYQWTLARMAAPVVHLGDDALTLAKTIACRLAPSAPVTKFAMLRLALVLAALDKGALGRGVLRANARNVLVACKQVVVRLVEDPHGSVSYADLLTALAVAVQARPVGPGAVFGLFAVSVAV
mmetsp:Transcript_104306/g.185439  ORF Transcript_104306/g.185439 Transcript_104306/m.185439 type:complete len:337 (+) Transcript_104306:1721-2731(+)